MLTAASMEWNGLPAKGSPFIRLGEPLEPLPHHINLEEARRFRCGRNTGKGTRYTGQSLSVRNQVLSRVCLAICPRSIILSPNSAGLVCQALECEVWRPLRLRERLKFKKVYSGY